MNKLGQYKVGMTIYGQVSGIKPYGAFVNFDDGISGLIHISEISNGFVRNVENFIKVGDYVFCRIIDIDEENKQLRLSYKSLKRNHRQRYNRIPFLGLPSNKLGFSSLAQMMQQWQEEAESVKG